MENNNLTTAERIAKYNQPIEYPESVKQSEREGRGMIIGVVVVVALGIAGSYLFGWTGW